MLKNYCNTAIRSGWGLELHLSDVLSPAVRCWAPASVRIGRQETPQLVLLEALQQSRVVQDGADVRRRQRLGALRAGDGHPALGDLDAQVLAQAVGARVVGAGGEAGEVAPRLTEQAQRALLHVLVQELLLAAGGQGQDAGGAAADACTFSGLSGCRSSSAFSSFSRRSSRFGGLFCREV